MLTRPVHRDCCSCNHTQFLPDRNPNFTHNCDYLNSWLRSLCCKSARLGENGISIGVEPTFLYSLRSRQTSGSLVPANLVRSRLGTSKLPTGNDLRKVNDADSVSNASHAQSRRSSQCDPKPTRLTRSILHPWQTPVLRILAQREMGF